MSFPLPEYLQRSKDLYWALRTRILTNEEIEEVRKIGYSIVLDYVSYYEGEASTSPYKESEKREEFNNALFNQFKMKLIQEIKEKE